MLWSGRLERFEAGFWIARLLAVVDWELVALVGRKLAREDLYESMALDDADLVQ